MWALMCEDRMVSPLGAEGPSVIATRSPTSCLPGAAPSAARHIQHWIVGGPISNPNVCAMPPDFLVSQAQLRSEFAIHGRAVDVLRGVQENISVLSGGVCLLENTLCSATVHDKHYHHVPNHPLRNFHPADIWFRTM